MVIIYTLIIFSFALQAQNTIDMIGVGLCQLQSIMDDAPLLSIRHERLLAVVEATT